MARSRKSAKKREAIVRAAIEVINERGYAYASMTEIAAMLDLRDAALYYYFPSKQAIAYECHLRSFERYEACLREADAAGKDGLDKLKQFLWRLLKDGERNGPHIYFGDYSYLDQAQQEAANARGAELNLTLERFLVEGMADGSIRPCEPTIVTQLISGMIIWMPRWATPQNGLTAQQLMTAVETFGLRGLAARS